MYFIFPVFPNLGMAKVEIKAMILGVQRKITNCNLNVDFCEICQIRGL